MPKARPFTAQALQQAKQCAEATPTWLNRPTVMGIAIDSEDTFEVDDAIWLEPNVDTGGATLWVHVADPTAFIPHGSVLDLEILEHCQTIYGHGFSDPMMPFVLSSQAISIGTDESGTAKPSLSVSMEIDAQGHMSNIKLEKTVLRSGAARLSYNQADDALMDALNPKYAMLHYLDVWAHKLTSRRRLDGGFAGTPQGTLVADEDGNLVPMPFRSQQLVAEFMIAANTAVARYLHEKGVPGLFRNQAWIDGTTWQTAHDLQLLVYRTDLLERARYQSIAHGHASLRLAQYTHFTSPLRRGTDYVNHRIVSAMLEHSHLPYSPSQLEQLAENFNIFVEQHSQFKDESNRQLRHYQAMQKANREGLQELDEKDFLRVLTNSLEGKTAQLHRPYVGLVTNEQSDELDLEWTSGVLEETNRRLKTAAFISAETLDKILEWAAKPVGAVLRSAMLNLLTAQPYLAATILNRRNGSRSVVYVEIGNAGDPQFLAWATVLEKTTREPGIDSSRQGAKNAACTAWCRDYLENSLIVKEALSTAAYENVVNDSADTEQISEITEIDTSINYIGLVNEWCQKQGIASPDYSDCTATSTGFLCKAWLEWQGSKIYGQASSRTKQQAKRQAAASLLSKLTGKVHF